MTTDVMNGNQGALLLPSASCLLSPRLSPFSLDRDSAPLGSTARGRTANRLQHVYESKVDLTALGIHANDLHVHLVA
jgi:hypothetical protein